MAVICLGARASRRSEANRSEERGGTFVEELSLILWRERELMELLLYKLEQEQLVLAAGRTQWLATASREVEGVIDLLQKTEVIRAAAADVAAADVGLLPNPSLGALAERVDEPWRSILLEHRTVFLDYTRRITELAAVNRGLLNSGYRSTQETLMSLSEQTTTYSHDGTRVAGEQRRALVDRSM